MTAYLLRRLLYAVPILIGVNLLREGLDLPEVSLVAILDADKEGFLRSERSLIQTSGRAARNVAGRVILYADVETGSMKSCLEETNRRRILQRRYNEEHGITPESVRKAVSDVLTSIYEADYVTVPVEQGKAAGLSGEEDAEAVIRRLRIEMKNAADRLEFEKAAKLRDEIRELTSFLMAVGEGPAAVVED